MRPMEWTDSEALAELGRDQIQRRWVNIRDTVADMLSSIQLALWPDDIAASSTFVKSLGTLL